MKFSIFYKNIFNHVSCGQSNNLITTYQNDNNKKEIYFKLTVAREHLFLEQQARHQKYIERDITFLK